MAKYMSPASPVFKLRQQWISCVTFLRLSVSLSGDCEQLGSNKLKQIQLPDFNSILES